MKGRAPDLQRMEREDNGERKQGVAMRLPALIFKLAGEMPV